MSDYIKTWFISDTHFGHANIIKYCNRPFATVAEMNQAMIERWQARVAPQDHIWHLGDIGFIKPEALPSLLSSLPGHKHLIMGNHDKGSPWRYRDAGFETVIENKSKHLLAYHDIDAGGVWIRLCHYPGWHDKLELRQPFPRPTLMGHIHDKPHNLGSMYHNICVEKTNYAPVSLEEALKL